MNKKWAMPTDVGTGRACSHNSANLAGAAQRPDCAPECVTTLREGKKSKKLLRFFTAGGLAFFMGVGTLCGVLITPMHSAQASVGSEETLTPQEQLLAGTLELDPETDPVVYTTDYGLEIKFHNAFTEVDYMGLSSYKGSTGFIYFTMGSYGNTAVNWIIIGRASDVSSFSDYYLYDGVYSLFGKTFEKEYVTYAVPDYSNWPNAGAQYYKNNPQESTTPAGAIISSEINQDLICDYKSFWVANQLVETSEIPSGCILCLSEKNILWSAFRSSGNNYNGSTLQTQMTNLYSSGLGLTSTQKAQIQAQTLSTKYSGGTSSISSQYLFPLAGASSSESYYIGTYLTSASARDIDATYWTRSGYSASDYAGRVMEDGFIGYSTYHVIVNSSQGVRPAFVLKI